MIRAIQIKNGKGEGIIFFRDPHISRTWNFRDPHITRGFWYPYIPKIAFSGPSHTKNHNFTTPTYKKCHFRDPPHTKDYAHALNRDQQKIEALQNIVCILEIQINTKVIQNCIEIEINILQFKKLHGNDKFLQSFGLKIVWLNSGQKM